MKINRTEISLHISVSHDKAIFKLTEAGQLQKDLLCVSEVCDIFTRSSLFLLGGTVLMEMLLKRLNKSKVHEIIQYFTFFIIL